ncbi:MAG TPA: STAS domain-containing protein [Bryobacteraceae bacterium]|nr:STAS domain-containing protein [Bryobacteraceae bacterium]
MSIRVNNRQVGDVNVVEVIGRITIGEGSIVLRDSVQDLVQRKQLKILLNLGEVPYIDSSGIGELVSAYSAVTKGGGQLKLSNLTKRVKDLLKISRHDMLFDIHEEEATAVNSFN